MAVKRHTRRIARESAVALLYSSDITETDIAQIVEEGAYPADDFSFSEYAEALVLGVAEHRAEIDERLAQTSENWSVERMPVVDRALLRVAVYEMLFVDDVPVSVAINEAVEIAKSFGGEDDSSRFVNGVLGRIARAMQDETGQSASADAPADGVDIQAAEGVEDAAETDEGAAAEAAEAAEADAADAAEAAEAAEAADAAEAAEADAGVSAVEEE